MNIAIHASNGLSLHQFCLSLMRELQRRGHSITAIAKEDSFFSLLKDTGISLHNSRCGEDRIAPIEIIKYIVKIYHILKQEKCALIHLMSTKAILFATILARCMGIKVICVFTGLGHTFTLAHYHPLRIAVILFLRVVLAAAHRVVFLNNDDQRYFVKKRIVIREKTHLIRSSGVDIARYKRGALEYPANPHFIFAGCLMRIKGILRFLRAACAVHEAVAQARFIVVAGNEYGNRAMIRDEELEHYQVLLGDSLKCVGKVHDVRSYLQQSSVLVLPTRYREGVPQSILEAMAYKLPIIATDMPGCREAVINKKNGFLIPPADHDTLVNAMRYFINNPQEIAAMGKRSYEYVCKNFTTEIVNNATIALYRRIGLNV